MQVDVENEEFKIPDDVPREVLVNDPTSLAIVKEFGLLFKSLYEEFRRENAVGKRLAAYEASRAFREALLIARNRWMMLEQGGQRNIHARDMIECVLKVWGLFELVYLSPDSVECAHFLVDWQKERLDPDISEDSPKQKRLARLVLSGQFTQIVDLLETWTHLPKDIRKVFCSTLLAFPMLQGNGIENAATNSMVVDNLAFLTAEQYKLWHQRVEQTKAYVKNYPELAVCIKIIQCDQDTLLNECKNWLEYLIATVQFTHPATTKENLKHLAISCMRRYNRVLEPKTEEWLLLQLLTQPARKVLGYAQKFICDGGQICSWLLPHLVDVLRKGNPMALILTSGEGGEETSFGRSDALREVREWSEGLIADYTVYLTTVNPALLTIYLTNDLSLEVAQKLMKNALDKLELTCPSGALLHLLDFAKHLGLENQVSKICTQRHRILLENALHPPKGEAGSEDDDRDDVIDHILGATRWLRRSGDSYAMIKFAERVLEEFWKKPDPWESALHEIGEAESRQANGENKIARLQQIEDFISQLLYLHLIRRDLLAGLKQYDMGVPDLSAQRQKRNSGQAGLLLQRLGVITSPQREPQQLQALHSLSARIREMARMFFDSLVACLQECHVEGQTLNILTFALPVINALLELPMDHRMSNLAAIEQDRIGLLKRSVCTVMCSAPKSDNEKLVEVNRAIGKLHVQLLLTRKAGADRKPCASSTSGRLSQWTFH